MGGRQCRPRRDTSSRGRLVHVTPDPWEVSSLPGVSLGTSWYSADLDRHADITEARVVTPGPERTSSRRYGAASRSGPALSKSWTTTTRPRLVRYCWPWA